MDIFERYVEVIGESVPLMMIPEDWSDEEIAQALQKCIDKRKPFNIADYDETYNTKRKY